MRIGFLLKRARPYRAKLLMISAISIAGSAAMLAMPYLAGQLLGGVLDGADTRAASGALSSVAGIALLLFVALLVNTALSIAASIISARTAGQVLADLRLETYCHVQSLPMAYHDRARQGDLLALMTYEVSHLSEFLSSSLASLPAMVLTAAGSMILLFLLDPIVAIALPILFPLFYIALKLAGRHLRELAAKSRAAEAQLVSLVEEDLEILPAIKAFAIEQQQSANYDKSAREAFHLGFAQARINAFLGPITALVAAVCAIILLLLAGDIAPAGMGRDAAETRSNGELFSLLFYAALLTRPVAALSNFYSRLQWARGTLTRLENVLETPVEPGLKNGKELERANGGIAFENISFAYPGREPILREFNLEIASGEIIALTGMNGAGKSTLINLLMRFYEPDQGRVAIDGRDIFDLQVQALRRQFGLVPQSPLLFGGSIRDNIVLGAQDASEEAIAKALKLAQADEFIAGLPKGLDTQIGDHGVRLSGGQRQRIALARALLPDPPVLIFDEATSMYDLAGEEAFVEACQTALKGRTVLIVTHRRASLALADRIIRIEDGQAFED